MEIPEDNFDDELEMEEQEAEEEKKEKTETKAKKATGKAIPAQAKAEGGVKERYSAIHQPERIVIVDNVAGTIILDNFKDEGTASGIAMMLNMQEKALTSLGA